MMYERHVLKCFLQTVLGLDRESAAEKVLWLSETKVRGIFYLWNALLSTNFGSTGSFTILVLSTK